MNISSIRMNEDSLDRHPPNRSLFAREPLIRRALHACEISYESRSQSRRLDMTMGDQTALREHLIRLLDWRDAHASFEAVVSDWPPQLRGIKPTRCPHTAWQLLEHIRICQWDILEFSRDPDHVSPDFPSAYWPATEQPPDDAAWDRSVHRFLADLQQMKRLLADASIDLSVPIPHGQGQTILREALVVADHNAYHLGQMLLLKRLLGIYEDS